MQRKDQLPPETRSSDILMFPDDAKGRATTFEISESVAGVGHRRLREGTNPSIGSLMRITDANTRKVPFDMYGKQNVVAEGKLTYGPQGLTGKGELRYMTAKHNVRRKAIPSTTDRLKARSKISG